MATFQEYYQLMAVAEQAKKYAYAPYSKFPVGAAILTGSGKIFVGANIENASYCLTICAERAAVVNAVANGEKKFKAIAIDGGKDKNIYPCGACLQVLSEFNPQIEIIFKIKGKLQIKKLDQLLTKNFRLEIH